MYMYTQSCYIMITPKVACCKWSEAAYRIILHIQGLNTVALKLFESRSVLYLLPSLHSVKQEQTYKQTALIQFSFLEKGTFLV